MDLSKFERKHVRIADIYGETFTGMASYGVRDFLMHEYGGDEDGVFIEDALIYRSQIASIEEIDEHLVRTSFDEGLTMKEADRCIEMLGTEKGQS